MAISAAERKAVIKVFRSEGYEDLDEQEAADLIIEAINNERDRVRRYAVVTNLKWPECDAYHLYVSGPFNTERQAEAVGVRFAADPKTHRGKGRWRVVPILAPVGGSAQLAWNEVKPDERKPCCSLDHGWIRDEIGQYQWIKYDASAEHWRERGGW